MAGNDVWPEVMSQECRDIIIYSETYISPPNCLPTVIFEFLHGRDYISLCTSQVFLFVCLFFLFYKIIVQNSVKQLFLLFSDFVNFTLTTCTWLRLIMLISIRVYSLVVLVFWEPPDRSGSAGSNKCSNNNKDLFICVSRTKT